MGAQGTCDQRKCIHVEGFCVGNVEGWNLCAETGCCIIDINMISLLMPATALREPCFSLLSILIAYSVPSSFV